CYGKCMPSADCVDSDGGINEFVQGVVTTAYSAGSTNSFVDTCWSDGMSVIEYYCDLAVGSSTVASMVMQCPNGCSNGACF
ncbi:MAG: hypothetical protein V3T05_08870, partial [Myxococcota bacterium]